MHRRDLHKYSKIGMVAISIILILDAINISSILSIPFNNLNLDLWNILVVIILYVLTYEIIQKRDNCRKKNQEEFARILLENTYRECYSYKNIIADEAFKKICPKRFPGDQTMENNAAYHNMRSAPFDHDSVIFSLGEAGVISASNISNYLMVKNKYSIYFSNVTIFPDVDEITNPLKRDLEHALDKANNELKK
ncbi:hypothetical protein MCG98_01480 [Ruminococcus sp. OA3]|uniref:hypothetical protein n=1 Tax=Ruminococcus sp. OA3 TaxID=2914164 RepID=UPI001F06F4AB|nr:hypothetical protein [Ruminococcus sp. OA3]MCH1981248.1 hypothetical protein [Ruminococcus sp. OA3]